MSVSNHYSKYEALFSQLKSVIASSNKRIIQEQPDPLFVDNVNFFTKSYLISLCTYLEAFLQDTAFEYTQFLQARIAAARIPFNVVQWVVLKEVKEKDLAFKNFALPITKKQLADELSGNPHKTIWLFRYLGIDLRKSTEFESTRELVGAVVGKRNSIIHHNDAAADVSMTDLVIYSDSFLRYMKAIDSAVSGAIAASNKS